MKPLAAVIGSVITLGVAIAGHAYSAVVTFEELVKTSEVIILARVVSVRDSGSGDARQRIGTATVIEWWKGSPRTNQVEYVASPGWFACDNSDAKAGETSVLFLERDSNDHRFHIAHFGRGRMPVGHERTQLCAAPYEVKLPHQIYIQRQQKYPHAEIVLVSSLRDAVRIR